MTFVACAGPIVRPRVNDSIAVDLGVSSIEIMSNFLQALEGLGGFRVSGVGVRGSWGFG